MVDDEPEVRQRLGGLERRGELARPHQQVVGEAGPPDGGEPADDVRAQQPVGVRLVVHLVADPDQAFAARRLAERGQVVGDGAGS